MIILPAKRILSTAFLQQFLLSYCEITENKLKKSIFINLYLENVNNMVIFAELKATSSFIRGSGKNLII